MPDTDEVVHYSVSDAVATITLDSPRNRNALSRQLVGELGERLERADSDEQVSVVVLRAEGRVFCSGADLSEASAGSMEEGAAAIVALQRRIVTLAKPVVVRLHGAVRAGGIGIVAAADIAISAEDTTYALTEVKLGLTPAVISMRWFVDCASKPEAYRPPGTAQAQPPGPGFPEQAPSVYTSVGSGREGATRGSWRDSRLEAR